MGRLALAKIGGDQDRGSSLVCHFESKYTAIHIDLSSFTDY